MATEYKSIFIKSIFLQTPHGVNYLGEINLMKATQPNTKTFLFNTDRNSIVITIY